VTTTAPRLSLATRGARAVVIGYQRAFAWRASPCRYVPTCSTYTLEAIESYGAVKGLWLGARRVARCHPWGGQGWDPVPAPPDDRRSPRQIP